MKISICIVKKFFRGVFFATFCYNCLSSKTTLIVLTTAHTTGLYKLCRLNGQSGGTDNSRQLLRMVAPAREAEADQSLYKNKQQEPLQTLR